MTLMHEKTLLIQPNFSSKKWRRVEKHIWSVVNASKNAFDPLSLLENNFDWLLEENTFDWLSLLKKTLLIRWIKSVFSCISVTWLHRPTGSNVGPPCNYNYIDDNSSLYLYVKTNTFSFRISTIRHYSSVLMNFTNRLTEINILILKFKTRKLLDFTPCRIWRNQTWDRRHQNEYW